MLIGFMVVCYGDIDQEQNFILNIDAQDAITIIFGLHHTVHTAERRWIKRRGKENDGELLCNMRRCDPRGQVGMSDMRA